MCLLILLFLLPLSASSTPTPSLLPSDLQSLLDIRNSLRPLPASSFFSSWLFSPNTNPCISFSGVTCIQQSSHLRVRILRLGTGLENSPGLSGPLPPSISNLTSLTELVIFPGRISGPIPTNLGTNCPNLRLISISNNLISGPIPSSLASLTNLHTLDLNHNQLSGAIPASFFYLPSLRVLVLASNKLSGGLPSSLAQSSLFHLDLQQNSLKGSLPQLPTTLSYLSVSDNSLAGPINAAAFSSNLTYIDLSMNAFTGRVPAAIFGFPFLMTILLHRNDFSGQLIFPGGVVLVPSWEVVDLSHNSITGKVPAELAMAQGLFINSNRFVGEVPGEIVGNVSEGRMSTFYAQHNFLTGVGEGSWAPQLPEAVSVCLAYNCMQVPQAVEGGCPVSAGTQEARPREQCPSE